MARVSVEDCLENVENRFQLVLVGTKRARQLANDDLKTDYGSDSGYSEAELSAILS